DLLRHRQRGRGGAALDLRQHRRRHARALRQLAQREALVLAQDADALADDDCHALYVITNERKMLRGRYPPAVASDSPPKLLLRWEALEGGKQAALALPVLSVVLFP